MKNFITYVFVLFLISCEDEPPIFIISQEKNLIDTGIYDSDSLDNSNQSDVINELENLPEVGTMSLVILDELILEYGSCTDIAVSSSCWDDTNTSKN